ncbi:5'/3'-nucleotidase SurE [Chitinophaga japonensis]|uniref:5'-nucleotidase SurE n=1 Tax=Chitinophaga japonensis TaxID=104662 RepID=A0A562TCX1_CHIJA|nr:5'/3'-nucleotidase SurE [Chitinophaga japonensis]TWI90850.1 5'-nucleotidase /3'-nucleotidase /exopolyphosphatase [Chitinophaga japonensis]
MADERTILVTNDDGITAPGIRSLIEAVSHLGRIVVVAPDSPQSGKGHAITIGVPLRLDRVDIFGDIEAWQCSGTPVDCVKLARDKILHRKPDICVSGINHGANHSINIIYSGTMSAAMEAAIEGIPSIGFSYLDYSFAADFTLPKQVAAEVTQKVLESDLPPGTLFNVNIPLLGSRDDFRGIKICRQANAKWVEEFDERRDPRGKKYFWLTGEFKNMDHGEDTDVWALENDYASLVPVQFDLTHYKLKERLEAEWKL